MIYVRYSSSHTFPQTALFPNQKKSCNKHPRKIKSNLKRHSLYDIHWFRNLQTHFSTPHFVNVDNLHFYSRSLLFMDFWHNSIVTLLSHEYDHDAWSLTSNLWEYTRITYLVAKNASGADSTLLLCYFFSFNFTMFRTKLHQYAAAGIEQKDNVFNKIKFIYARFSEKKTATHESVHEKKMLNRFVSWLLPLSTYYFIRDSLHRLRINSPKKKFKPDRNNM